MLCPTIGWTTNCSLLEHLLPSRSSCWNGNESSTWVRAHSTALKLPSVDRGGVEGGADEPERDRPNNTSLLERPSVPVYIIGAWLIYTRALNMRARGTCSHIPSDVQRGTVRSKSANSLHRLLLLLVLRCVSHILLWSPILHRQKVSFWSWKLLFFKASNILVKNFSTSLSRTFLCWYIRYIRSSHWTVTTWY